MSRLKLHQILLFSLSQSLDDEDAIDHMTQEEAYRTLKELTGQDFGLDEKAWKAWIKEHGLLED